MRRGTSSLSAFRFSMDFKAIKVVSFYKNKEELQNALNEMTNRGILLRSELKNENGEINVTFNIHSIVRKYCYNQLSSTIKRQVHYQLQDYYSSIPIPEKKNVTSVQDITQIIEYYFHTIMVEDYSLAHRFYNDEIKSYLYKFGEYHLMIELLESLFPMGMGTLPFLDTEAAKAQVLNELALAYKQVGQLINAIKTYQQHNVIRKNNNEFFSLSIGLGNISRVLFDIGNFESAITSVKEKIEIAKQNGFEEDIALGQLELGRFFAYMGKFENSDEFLNNGTTWFNESRNENGSNLAMLYQNIRYLLNDDQINVLGRINEKDIFLENVKNIERRVRYRILIAVKKIYQLERNMDGGKKGKYEIMELKNLLNNILKDCINHNLNKFRIETLLLFSRLYWIRSKLKGYEENDTSVA